MDRPPAVSLEAVRGAILKAVPCTNELCGKGVGCFCGHDAIRDDVLDQITPLLRAAAPGWQPIETAPKDGTWILGSDGARTYLDRRLIVMRWNADATPLPTWNDGEYTFTPYHWHPLPPAPTAAESK